MAEVKLRSDRPKIARTQIIVRDVLKKTSRSMTIYGGSVDSVMKALDKLFSAGGGK